MNSRRSASTSYKRGISSGRVTGRSNQPSGRRAVLEQLRDGRNQLIGRERLVQQHAVRHAPGRPLVAATAGDVEHRERWIDLAGTTRDTPAVEPAEQADVGNQRAVLGAECLQQRQRDRKSTRL